MVSGEIQSYKSNKGYYSAPSSHAPLNHPAAGKRFSDGALRPWPPMYRTPSARAQMASYQALSSNKFNFNNFNSNHLNNNNNNNNNNSNNINANNSIYGRNKFNFQQLNMAAAAAANGKYASAMNLANMKNAKNYFLVSQPYVKNSLALPPGGSFYGRTTDMNNNSNANIMLADKEKGRFRKLRNPTQTPPFRSSCACIRSKSMEDVRTEVVTDWPTYNKENYNEFKKNRLNNNGALGLMKHSTRRSMDNLLEMESNYSTKRYQVEFFSISPKI